MNTFGMKKKGINTFWLGKVAEYIPEVWKDAIRFSVFIKRKLQKFVEI